MCGGGCDADRPAQDPFPWFGGKADAAPAVWEALGDVDHYVEPFAGSLAVLLRRPHEANRTYHSETVNDLDGLLCNAWRSIQRSPEATADAASWPVCEADKHARHLALLSAGVRSGNLSTSWRTRAGMTRDGGLVDVGTVDLDRQRLVLRRGWLGRRR